MESGGDVMPLDLYEHMVTEDASGGASPGVSSTSNQAFLMDNWVHQLYEQADRKEGGWHYRSRRVIPKPGIAESLGAKGRLQDPSLTTTLFVDTVTCDQAS
ncbi:hypothetical protein E2C01_006497 [Portunus trituberculatus]|uniref:Uncharacterized protein n=1 Tax=Portunus trituberculatus TaxID=210409 RepID=A0A5B7D1Z8_PORTR|nr:hypothetical protein [Portunus trituberculatus]